MFAHCNGIGRLEIDLTKADISGMRCLFGGSTAVLSRDVVARCGQKVNRAAGLSRRGEPDEKHTCPANSTKGHTADGPPDVRGPASVRLSVLPNRSCPAVKN